MDLGQVILPIENEFFSHLHAISPQMLQYLDDDNEKQDIIDKYISPDRCHTQEQQNALCYVYDDDNNLFTHTDSIKEPLIQPYQGYNHDIVINNTQNDIKQLVNGFSPK